MTIYMPFTVSEAQLAALRSVDDRGYIRPGNGIRWSTIKSMARADRGWVTLAKDEQVARITRSGVAMMTIGREERERYQQRAGRRSMARGIDPFRLLRRSCARPTFR